MNYSELKRSLSVRVENVYILYGSDDFLRNHAADMILQRTVSMPELNFVSIDGENISGSSSENVFASLRCYPFLSEKRAALIKDYYPSSDELKKSGLFDYCSDPSGTSVLIINNKKECKSFDKLSNILKVNCTADLSLCVGWICNEAKKASIQIEPKAAETLARYCMLDFTKISCETAKLIDYCAESGKIDQASIEEIVHKDSEYKIYEMTEHIASSSFDRAYEIMTELLNGSENEQRLFVSVYSHFRRMLFIAMSDADNAELAEILGVKEYAVKMTRRQLGKFSISRLKEICAYLAEYDLMFKAGDITIEKALWNGVFGAMIKNQRR